MKMVKLYFFAALLPLFIGCKKDAGTPADTELPRITLTSPVNNQTFTGGQTVSVTGTVTDNNKLREVHLEITNNTTGAFITHEHFAPDAASFALARTFTLTAGNSYKIKVEADDKNDNEAKTELTIVVN